MHPESNEEIARLAVQEIEADIQALEALQSHKREVLRLLITESDSSRNPTSANVLENIRCSARDGNIPASCSLRRTEWLDGEDSMCIASPVQPSRFPYTPLFIEGNLTRDESSGGFDHENRHLYRLALSVSSLRKKSIERFLRDESGKGDCSRDILAKLHQDYMQAIFVDRECAKRMGALCSTDDYLGLSSQGLAESLDDSSQKSMGTEESIEYGTDAEDSVIESPKLRFIESDGLGEYLGELRRNFDEQVEVLFKWVSDVFAHEN